MVHFPSSAKAAHHLRRPQIGHKNVFIRQLARAAPIGVDLEEARRCHSDILNYITISHTQAFFENFFDSSF